MGGFVVGAGFLLLALIFGAGGGGKTPPGVTPPKGGRDPDPDPKLPGTGRIKPGPNNEGPPPGAGGWGGGQYGPGPVPSDFDWAGSIPWISTNCETIAEPLYFMPIPGSHQLLSWWMPHFGTAAEVNKETQPGLMQALIFVGPAVNTPLPAKGTVWGYVGRQVAEMQRRNETIDPVVIATRILVSVVQMQEAMTGIENDCLDAVDALDTSKWSNAMLQWWETLVKRVEAGIDIFVNDWAAWACCEDQDIPAPFKVE